MAISTYAELKASVADWATKTGLDSQIVDCISWAHQEICRRIRAPLLYKRTPVTLDAETVSAPTDFLAARRFYLDTSPRRVLQLKDSAELIEMTANSSPGDYPSAFAVEGRSTFAMAPLFSGTVTGQLLYYAAPAKMVGDSDTNVVLATYPFLYLYGALEALYRYLEDDNNCDRYGQLFGALIESVNKEEAADALRGPLVGSPGVGAVV